MDDRTLAALEHDNMIAADMAAAAHVPGSIVRREGGVALLLTGLPMRLFNQVLVADDSATPGAVSAAVEIARGRGDRFAVTLRRGTDDRFHAVVGDLGLVALPADPWMPGMVLHPTPPVGRAAAAGHEIRQVTDADGLAHHRSTAAAGFGIPVEWLEAVITEDLARRADARVYVGYADGLPVTAGLGIRTGRTIGVYNVATVESARGRGYGSAMTMRIVDDGTAAGCDVAILQASDQGRPIYERLDFRTVVEYIGYVDPERLPAGA